MANQPIEIIGVLEKPEGLFAFGSMEVYMPFQTWRMMYGSTDYTQVTMQADDPDHIQTAGKKAEKTLNDLHNTEESYQVINMEEIAAGVGQITNIMTLIIGSIAGISLFVGGIGVMNIMLVSVTERTREIGIRMALGATRNQVLTQFLIEVCDFDTDWRDPGNWPGLGCCDTGKYLCRLAFTHFLAGCCRRGPVLNDHRRDLRNPASQ